MCALCVLVHDVPHGPVDGILDDEEQLDAGYVRPQPLEVEDIVGELQQARGLRDDQLVRIRHRHLVLTNQIVAKRKEDVNDNETYDVTVNALAVE